MSAKRGRQWRKGAGLTWGQMALLFFLIVILFMSAALVLGYNLGVFDPLLKPESSSQPQKETPDLQSNKPNTPAPNGQEAIPPITQEVPAAIYSTLASPTLVAPEMTERGSITATVTDTPTITPTPPIDVCAQLDLRFISAISNVAAWRLQNTSGVSLTLTRAEIAWPESNDAIFNAFLDGAVIWSSEDLVSPTFVTSWIGEPGDRDVDGLSRLEFFFGTSAASHGYDLKLRFDNGCEVATSN